MNVNTFDAYPIEINRYNAQGILIEEPTGCITMSGAPLGDSLVRTMTDADCGYSHVGIQPSGYWINANTIGDSLC